MEKDKKLEAEVKEEATEKEEKVTTKKEEPKELDKKEEIELEPIMQEERRCIKCNNIMNENNKFCTICGSDQKTIEQPKKKKTRKKNNNLKSYQIALTSSAITLIVCLVSTFLLVMYLDENEVNIDTSNKNVTINDTGIADAVDKIYDAVVVVENYVNERLYGTGSGFVYKTDNKYGYILTNSHVLTSSTEAYVKFSDEEKVKAEIVGLDEYSDVAVLKVAKKYVSQVAITGSTKKLRIGDTLFAIGAPLDSATYSWSVTRGILSGKDRVVASETSYMTVLQTDTPINSGNSGGPLCNANGEVIGITNMKLASEQIEGMGFAIPIETALEYAEMYVNGTDLRRPYIGVAIYDSGNSFFSQESHVVVESVEKGSPAEKAGMMAGDIITKIEGDEVENSSYFKYKLYEHEIGDTVKITVERKGKEKTLKVKLGTNSKEA